MEPFHEADIHYFWWSGGGADYYKKLWDMMFRYFMDERGLNNLIWVWNGQSKEFLVSIDKFDIASLDIYLRKSIYQSSHKNLIEKSQNLVPTKMVAQSECEIIPEPSNLLDEKAGWLWNISCHNTYIFITNEKTYSPLPTQPYAHNPKHIKAK